jgi:hypothetical protein
MRSPDTKTHRYPWPSCEPSHAASVAGPDGGSSGASAPAAAASTADSTRWRVTGSEIAANALTSLAVSGWRSRSRTGDTPLDRADRSDEEGRDRDAQPIRDGLQAIGAGPVAHRPVRWSAPNGGMGRGAESCSVRSMSGRRFGDASAGRASTGRAFSGGAPPRLRLGRHVRWGPSGDGRSLPPRQGSQTAPRRMEFRAAQQSQRASVAWLGRSAWRHVHILRRVDGRGVPQRSGPRPHLERAACVPDVRTAWQLSDACASASAGPSRLRPRRSERGPFGSRTGSLNEGSTVECR